MSNFNKVILMGRLTRDPEIKIIGTDNTVVNFGIAVSEFYKGEETTNFFDCEAFGKTAEHIGKFFNKGKGIHVEGVLKQDKWEDKNGEKRSKVFIKVLGCEFVGPPKNESQVEQAPTKEINTKKRAW